MPRRTALVFRSTRLLIFGCADAVLRFFIFYHLPYGRVDRVSIEVLGMRRETFVLLEVVLVGVGEALTWLHEVFTSRGRQCHRGQEEEALDVDSGGGHD